MFLSAGTQPATLILIGWLFELWLATANHGYAKNKNVYIKFIAHDAFLE